MSADRLTALYRVETPLPVERAAEVLASEQSSGTFVEVPGETPELRQRFAARIERIEDLGTVDAPSLPGARPLRPGQPLHRAVLTVSWPIENFGCNLPTLLATVQGNLFELSQFSGLKLLDLSLPESLTLRFRGPAYGVEGTRRLTGVQNRPLIGTIIKPSIGLSPAQTAELVKTLVEAGIDFIKDDELMANPPHSPLQDRVTAVMSVINDHAQRTGKKVMYAFNISDELDSMLAHYDCIVSHGGTCAMLSINQVGLSAVKRICDRGALAIHAHRNGFGMIHRHPMLGVEFAAYQKIWRLVGVDQLHVNGIANKFWEPDDSVAASIHSCLAELHGLRRLLPVISSGQTGLQAPETYRRTKTVDLLYQAGGGIMAHPLGPAAGVAALRQAWEAAVLGVDLAEYARTRPELREQIRKFASAG
ncbi:MAG: ribulose-bisphosphate carboxylase large subunit family protein [Phycisphaerae bacterium]|nr:ribulose-bisphosphate carboxylase large subunit family protein [Phycisphaerae bacterium]MDW8261214.1 ribulose-bisphosphate carboxylase large subunit family protein [Phycisphaerales bacterium]